MTLGEQIATTRTEKHISQEDLARGINISVKRLVKWETDQLKPSVTMLRRMAEFLGVTMDYLAQSANDPSAAPDLSDEAVELAKEFEKLDSAGRSAVCDALSHEKDRMYGRLG